MPKARRSERRATSGAARFKPLLLLGAHVSAAGGVDRAPERAAEIGANVIQIFTKQPNRWAEPSIDAPRARAFRSARRRHGIRVAGAHDSYLINLASPDAQLRERSYRSFCRELERCRDLKLDFLVTHPGNATDGDRGGGLERNAEAIRRALQEADGGTTTVLLEITAGQGTALGASFMELAWILESIGESLEERLGVCLDTAHLFAAGYDLVNSYEAVMSELESRLGLDKVRLLHLNDSRSRLGSRVDRHEHIGEGQIGAAPFRRIMSDPRFRRVPKLIETPKGSEPPRADRRNLNRLRRWATARPRA